MIHHNHPVSIIENQPSSIQYRLSAIASATAGESSYLRAYKAPLHLSRTLYKSTLFMQNKPNSLNVQIYINVYYTEDYKNFIPLAEQKNKPNSNPIKPNFQKAKMNVNSLITKDYRKKDDFAVRINKPNSRKTQNEHKYLYYKGL